MLEYWISLFSKKEIFIKHGCFRGFSFLNLRDKCSDSRRNLNIFEDREIVPYDPSVFVVYILSLAVDAAYRRMGLATRLLQHLFDIVGFLKSFLEKKILKCYIKAAPRILYVFRM